jgi:23S rRNA (pseudouridine1915-N3)-methyltransferase
MAAGQASNMQVHVLTIGKWKKREETALYESYIKRVPWQVTLHELTGFPKLEVKARQQKETQLLYDTAKQLRAEQCYMLDETLPSSSSVQFAARLQAQMEQGVRAVAFLIGGDTGLDKGWLAAAQVQGFSFGAMTWPHLLVRVMLAEQLYRAYTILTNHPYHRV